MPTKCHACPLRKLDLFEPFSPDDADIMQSFKIGERTVTSGSQILEESQSSAKVYTVLSGLGLRHKMTKEGRRQVVGFAFPGDFLGLPAGIMGEMSYSVEATTDMVLCVFNRDALWEMFKKHPKRALALTQIAVREETILAEVLTVLGQKPAIARVAWALKRFHDRLVAMNVGSDGRVPMPFRQQDMAEGLGLSLVHTNKTLSRLRAEGIADWDRGWLSILDARKLEDMAGIDPGPLSRRPLM